MALNSIVYIESPPPGPDGPYRIAHFCVFNVTLVTYAENDIQKLMVGYADGPEYQMISALHITEPLPPDMFAMMTDKAELVSALISTDMIEPAGFSVTAYTSDGAPQQCVVYRWLTDCIAETMTQEKEPLL